MATYGYARVSTREQDLTAQVAALRDAGCARVFQEKASGIRSDRAELMRVLRRLEPGDVLLVTRLDRLARSTRDLLKPWLRRKRASDRSPMPGLTRPRRTGG